MSDEAGFQGFEIDRIFDHCQTLFCFDPSLSMFERLEEIGF